jgi:uncharacterized membrane protein
MDIATDEMWESGKHIQRVRLLIDIWIISDFNSLVKVRVFSSLAFFKMAVGFYESTVIA